MLKLLPEDLFISFSFKPASSHHLPYFMVVPSIDSPTFKTAKHAFLVHIRLQSLVIMLSGDNR